jgi:hypothetical protein
MNVYTQYIQGLCQSRLSAADHALTLVAFAYESESESELLYDWRFTANQFVFATSPSRPTARNFYFPK